MAKLIVFIVGLDAIVWIGVFAGVMNSDISSPRAIIFSNVAVIFVNLLLTLAAMAGAFNGFFRDDK